MQESITLDVKALHSAANAETETIQHVVKGCKMQAGIMYTECTMYMAIPS